MAWQMENYIYLVYNSGVCTVHYDMYVVCAAIWPRCCLVCYRSVSLHIDLFYALLMIPVLFVSFAHPVFALFARSTPLYLVLPWIYHL